MVTISTSLLCAATIFINMSGFDWNMHDQKILKRAEYVCGNDKRYEGSTCVKFFTKTEKQVYRVLCGEIE